MGRGLAAFGSGFVNTFLRDNRVLPPVLALLALLVFAWIVAGIFVGGPDEERQTSNEANLAQSEDAPGSDPLAPEVENRNVESYAAYQSKDPFRQLLPAAAGETTAATTPETTTEDTAGETTTGRGPGRGGGGGLDTDGDGLSDRREFDLGLDPANPDTDDDGTVDGEDDEARGGGAGGGGAGNGAGAGSGAGDGAGRRGAGDDPGAGRRGNSLPESGGDVPLR